MYLSTIYQQSLGLSVAHLDAPLKVKDGLSRAGVYRWVASELHEFLSNTGVIRFMRI